MSKLSKCCCECCIEPEELPDITIANMTGGSWIASECCYVKRFTFNQTPTTTTACTAVFEQSQFSASAEVDVYSIKNVVPPVFTSQQPFPLDIEHCCPVGSDLAGSYTANCHGIRQKVMKVGYRPAYIDVRASKQDIQCGENPGCKFILSADYVYYYETLILEEEDYEEGWDFEVNPANSCWTQNGGTLTPPCSKTLDPLSNTFDCSSTLNPSLLKTFKFTKVLTFDAWPVGDDAVFNSEAYPAEGCEPAICDSGEYDTQVCLSATGQECTYQCQEATIYTDEVTVPNFCGSFATQYVMECGGEFPVITAVTNTAIDSRTCPGIFRGALAYPADTSGLCDDSSSCFRLAVNDVELLDPRGQADQQTIPDGAYYLTDFPCFVDNETCDWQDDPCGGGFLRTFPYFLAFYTDVKSYAYSTTCTKTTQSVCVNAPTWTITFA